MSLPSSFSRRNFLAFAGIGAVSTLAGCASTVESGPVVSPVQYTGAPAYRPFRSWFSSYDGEQPDPAVIYAAVEDGGFLIPPVPYQQIDPQFYRQRVVDPTGEAPGSVVVNTRERHLYVTEAGGTAMRYGIGVGREGFAWQGRGVIQWRKKWPRWNPPDEMVARQPELVKFSIANGGMDPGLKNPLGARALYIFEDKQDSLYRLHGNPDWRSIGKAVSSGCVRLLNQDVIDLYDRVPERAPILVTQA
ncbi:L,D-transpeptidase [Rhizobium rhizogenes]|uniref:L,D-transpeptidase n=1 Tax=Rhizobium rhizogenes TaxID=359 RepID=UPI0006478367|nr:L,D-transpeptidase [Rhizobium rhizogenes]